MPPPPSAAQQRGAEFATGETMFFQRRAKRKFPLLPWLLIVVLVFGTLALVLWALNRSKVQQTTATSKPADPFAGRPILTPEEARRQANQSTVVSTPTPAPTTASTPAASTPPPRAAAVNSPSAGSTPPPPAASANPNAEVRRALPVMPGETDRPPVLPDESGPVNFDLKNAENSQIKADVLQRVDLMPEVSRENKDKLYAAVDRARGMGRVSTIAFEKGKATIGEKDIERLNQRTQAPDIKKLTADPTVVFVILGYADPKGDPKVNQQISLSRARSVMDALRDRCGFQNVMHAVAMGGSNLFSDQQAEKNRIVEVWAVLP